MMPLLLFIIWLVTRNVKVSNLGEFFKKRGIIGVAGGFWAMIPDIDYFLEEPVFNNAAWCDVFFFHRYCDVVLGLPETDLFFAAQIMLFFIVINVFAIAVTVESFKRLGEAMFGKKEDEEEEPDHGPQIIFPE